MKDFGKVRSTVKPEAMVIDDFSVWVCTDIQEVNKLIKQIDQTRKMMKMVSGMGSSKMAQMANAMKAMRGGMPKM